MITKHMMMFHMMFSSLALRVCDTDVVNDNSIYDDDDDKFDALMVMMMMMMMIAMMMIIFFLL